MKDFTNIYKIIDKLREIEPCSKLEEAVIKNTIHSHLIAMHNEKLKESKCEIMNYTSEEFSEVMQELNDKIGKM